MKILHVITGLQYGGAENLLFQLLQHREFQSFDHKIISLTDFGPIGKSMKQLGIDVIAMNLSVNKNSLRTFHTFLKIIQDYQPDVIQTWLYHADLIGAMARIFGCRIPLVWGVHHQTKHLKSFKRTTRMVININRILSKWIPERIVCCSQSVYDAHNQLGYPESKMVVINNGVNCDQFVPNEHQWLDLREECGISTSAFIIGFGGRWFPSKGHPILIEAASILVERYPDIHFLLWGPGIDEGNHELMDLMRKFNVMQHFHILGSTPNVTRMLQGIDVYVSPSLDEALPISVAEAMACQVPCVVTDVGDQGRLVGKTGVVISPGDVQKLVNGINTIINLDENAKMQMGNEARAKIMEHFSLDTTAQAYSRLYHQLENFKTH